MADNNLKLWDQVSVTDISFTKPAKKGAYQFTSISPMYQKMQATKALGPQGINWGVEVGSETFEYKEIGTTTLLVYKAVMFYKFDGEVGKIPIAATEKIAYQTQGANGYLKIDDEADKKVKTAALTKGLSEIGVSADIFMNLHENHEYSEYASAKIRAESGDDEDIKKLKSEFTEWLDKQISALSLCPHPQNIALMANRIIAAMKDKLTLIKATPAEKEKMAKKVTNAADAAIAKLDEKAKG